MTRLVQSVKDAISEGIHPKMITKGSSGSYFARAKIDTRVQTVAYVTFAFVRRQHADLCLRVFKPKDEEPYGRLNPKVRVFEDVYQVFAHVSFIARRLNGFTGN